MTSSATGRRIGEAVAVSDDGDVGDGDRGAVAVANVEYGHVGAGGGTGSAVGRERAAPPAAGHGAAVPRAGVDEVAAGGVAGPISANPPSPSSSLPAGYPGRRTSLPQGLERIGDFASVQEGHDQLGVANLARPLGNVPLVPRDALHLQVPIFDLAGVEDHVGQLPV